MDKERHENQVPIQEQVENSGHLAYICKVAEWVKSKLEGEKDWTEPSSIPVTPEQENVTRSSHMRHPHGGGFWQGPGYYL